MEGVFRKPFIHQHRDGSLTCFFALRAEQDRPLRFNNDHATWTLSAMIRSATGPKEVTSSVGASAGTHHDQVKLARCLKYDLGWAVRGNIPVSSPQADFSTLARSPEMPRPV